MSDSILNLGSNHAVRKFQIEPMLVPDFAAPVGPNDLPRGLRLYEVHPDFETTTAEDYGGAFPLPSLRTP